MIAEILSIGTELLLGQIVNSDAQYLARKLSEAGIDVYRQVTVGDNPKRLREALAESLSRADMVITTGGLGPTADDLTKETTAALLGLPLERHEPTVSAMKAFFTRLGREMRENNLRQADFAQGSLILPNAVGTAPGCILETQGKRIIHLPGPPRELIPMVEEQIMPYLAQLSGHCIVSRYLRIFGMGESEVEARLRDLMEASTNPTLAPYCSLGEVQLRLTARCPDPAQAPAMFAPLEAEIRQRLGKVIYAARPTPDEGMEQVLVEALLARKKTLVLAESCTGGMLAASIISVPGASGVLMQGHVTYANEAKIETLGVSAETLAIHGAVSEDTAREMAQGARQRARTDYALATTGIAGPGGGTQEKPVGLVWIALDGPEGTVTKRLQLRGDRQSVRGLSCLYAMHLLLEELGDGLRRPSF